MTHKLASIAAACLVTLSAHVCARSQTTTTPTPTQPAAPQTQTNARDTRPAGPDAQGQPQTAGPRARPTPPVAPSQDAGRGDAGRPGASADENFELNITERRITEENFSASTAVELGDEVERGLSLRVGVAVGAERIDVLLRNVRGSVRFRASLEEVTRRLGLTRPAPPPP